MNKQRIIELAALSINADKKTALEIAKSLVGTYGIPTVAKNLAVDMFIYPTKYEEVDINDFRGYYREFTETGVLPKDE